MFEDLKPRDIVYWCVNQEEIRTTVRSVGKVYLKIEASRHLFDRKTGRSKVLFGGRLRKAEDVWAEVEVPK